MCLNIPSRLGKPNIDNEVKAGSRPSIGWIWHILYILYSFEVGVFLLFLPWLSIWENNYILYLYPQYRAIIANPYLKGAVLGIGVVNILIGIQEIVHLRKKSS